MEIDIPMNTFGTKAVVRIPQLQSLMPHICRKGFEHHAAMHGSHCADGVAEVLQSYLGRPVRTMLCVTATYTMTLGF
jgi:L-fucose isomerase-like protein